MRNGARSFRRLTRLELCWRGATSIGIPVCANVDDRLLSKRKIVRRASMINSSRVTLVTLAGVTLGGWASAQAAVPGAWANPFIYPSKGQTAQQEQKDKNECYEWASQQTGFDPAQELEEQQAAAARARQQSQQAQQAAVQQIESTQGQGVGGAVGGAAGGALVGAIAGNAGRGAAIGSAIGLLAGWHRRRAEEIAAANQQLQTQQQIAAQSAQQLAVSQQKLANYNLAFKTCMQGRGYTLN